MKKTHLLAATALVTTFMLGAPAMAADHAAHSAPAVKTATVKAEKPAKGPMHDLMMEMQEENKEERAELQAKRDELHKIATAPTFDKEAYLTKHEEMQELRAKMAKNRAEAMAAKLESMSAEDRAKLPDMKGPRPHGMGMGMGRGPMGMAPAAEKPAAEAPAKSK